MPFPLYLSGADNLPWPLLRKEGRSGDKYYLRLILKISETSEKEFTGKFDSPDQGTVDLPISRRSHDEGLVYFELKQANASFEGMMSPDGSEISGDWQQTNIMPLTFKWLVDVPKPNRPQEPKKLYPYDEEEVV